MVEIVGDRHPSLFFTLEEIATLKTLKTAPSHQALYNNIKPWADARWPEISPANPSGDWSAFRAKIDYMRAYIENMAFMYYMTGDAKYLNAGKSWLLNVLNWSTWSDGDERLMSIMAQITAFGYDAFYNNLTIEESTNIRNAMITNIGTIYDAKKNVYSLTGPRDSPNTMSRLMGGLGMAGLALRNEWSGAQTWINFAVTYGNLALQTIGQDGEGREGIGYMSSALREIVPFANSLLRITGQDLFATSHLSEVPYFYIYFNYNKFALQLEDAFWNESYLFDGYRVQLSELYLLSSKYNNGYGQWFADKYAAQYRMSSYLWKSPDLVAIPPSSGLPLTKRFRTYGYVVFRDSWADDALLFIFKSGTGLGHSHESQNEFGIYYKGYPITAGPGYIGGDSTDPTWMHNCILVNGAGQVLEGYAGSDNGELPPLGVGSIKSVDVHDPYYRYLVGDASKAYTGLDKWLRHVVFVEPNYFVMYDEMSASSPKQYDWLLHASANAYIGGTTPQHDITINDDLIHLVGNFGQDLYVKIVEPVNFDFQITDYSPDYGEATYIKLHPSVANNTAQFLTVFFPDSALSTEKVETGNIIGTKVINGSNLDLILFSKDGNPVDQWVELGGSYSAADGQTYEFSGIKVRAQFDTYQVMRLKSTGVGDVNRDGQVNTADITKVERIIVGLE